MTPCNPPKLHDLQGLVATRVAGWDGHGMYRDDGDALLARLAALEPEAEAAPKLRARVAELERENASLRIEMAKLAAAMALRVAERR